MKNIILTNPAYDTVTRHIAHWVSATARHISSLEDVQAVVLDGAEASREQLERTIKEHKPRLVFFNGHGDYANIFGYNGETLIREGDESMELLTNKIVHSWACQAGKYLGERLIKLGTTAFIGYKEDFKFNSLGNDPANDPVADLFLEPAFTTMVALSSGDKVKTAYNKSQRLSKRNLGIALTSGGPSGLQVAVNLFHNLTHQVVLGDIEASIAE